MVFSDFFCNADTNRLRNRFWGIVYVDRLISWFCHESRRTPMCIGKVSFSDSFSQRFYLQKTKRDKPYPTSLSCKPSPIFWIYRYTGCLVYKPQYLPTTLYVSGQKAGSVKKGDNNDWRALLRDVAVPVLFRLFLLLNQYDFDSWKSWKLITSHHLRDFLWVCALDISFQVFGSLSQEWL